MTPDQQFQITLQTQGRLTDVKEFEKHRGARQPGRLHGAGQ
jgi:hypothetical protein